MSSPDGAPEPSTITQAPLAPLEVGTFTLVAVAGPDPGVTLRIDGRAPTRVLVGQGPACDLRLTDPLVSRRHLAIEPDGPRLRLVDLESTNGTRVNGLAISEAFLSGGEVLELGGTQLRVDRGEATTVVVSGASSFGRTTGESAEMRRLYPLCRKLAASDVPVVIEGETGTGKEVLAESIHETGSRASGPFVVFDCVAVPANLLEAALFGHERGAFTGAVDSRKGVFEQAAGGTLFIDEIGDLDLPLQAKLLRALERLEVRRVGGDKWIRVDVRVLAATRRDLDREVQAGRFRDDLFFRLAVARIELPPLRRRHGDISVLATHFWKRLGGASPISPGLLQRFESYAWPGNVRELHNAVARHIALGELSAEVGAMRSSTPPPTAATAAATSDAMEEILGQDLPFVQARDKLLDEFQRRYVERVLAQHGGNVTHAAEASGIARRYFQTIRARSQPKP